METNGGLLHAQNARNWETPKGNPIDLTLFPDGYATADDYFNGADGTGVTPKGDLEYYNASGISNIIKNWQEDKKAKLDNKTKEADALSKDDGTAAAIAALSSSGDSKGAGKGGSSDTMLYVGITAVVLVVAGIAFFVLKDK